MTHGAHVADARTQCGGGGGDSGQAHGAGHRGAAPEPAQAAQGPQMGVLRVLLLQPGLVSRFVLFSLLSPALTNESFRALLSAVSSLDS